MCKRPHRTSATLNGSARRQWNSSQWNARATDVDEKTAWDRRSKNSKNELEKCVNDRAGRAPRCMGALVVNEIVASETPERSKSLKCVPVKRESNTQASEIQNRSGRVNTSATQNRANQRWQGHKNVHFPKKYCRRVLYTFYVKGMKMYFFSEVLYKDECKFHLKYDKFIKIHDNVTKYMWNITKSEKILQNT